jgi:hypothetical protein
MISIRSERSNYGSAFQGKDTACPGSLAEAAVILDVMDKSQVQAHPTRIL